MYSGPRIRVCIVVQGINTCVYDGLRICVYGRPRICVCMVVKELIRVYGSPRN